MNPAVSLLRLRQGNGAIEDYVVEFLELSIQEDFNEVALKDIFRVGLNEPIHSELPGGKIHFSLAEYIELGLQQLIDQIDYYRLWKSSTTILIID